MRERIRSFLKVSLPACTPDAQFIGQEVEDGIKRSLICYAGPDGDRIEAFLFQPEAAEPRGAVLALHQHNSQWLIGKSEIAGLAGDSFQAFGPALARSGVMVLAPDCIGFESRLGSAGWGTSLAPSLSKPHSTSEGWLQYYNQMAHRLVTGDLLMRKMIEDSSAGLSVLENLSAARHLGVVGHSLGGNTALFLSALDMRVVFSCASGSLCSFRQKLSSQTALEMALIIPGFCDHFDFDDLLRCIAPRKLFVVSSEDDPLSADAESLVRAALSTFDELNCAGHLQHLRTAGGHALDRERFEAIIDWMTMQAEYPGLQD